ncbi:sulfate transporter family protein [Microvirga sp. W0021]|uniref:Sulfate transporter family protein n=1 Tax=Hohaiivirga grylli TaxID=3133970 RepID=A0ABV0BHC5_9HYPH
MLFHAALLALRQVFSPAFRKILWKSLGLTVVLLAVLWASIRWFFTYLLANHSLTAQYPTIDWYIVLVSSIGLFLLFIYLLPAITAVVASFFIDDAASIVEQSDFPTDAPGTPAPLVQSTLSGIRFAVLSLIVNLFALALFFLPVINLVVFFVANAYLLGREYFELSASRFMPAKQAAALRKKNSLAVFNAGCLMAFLLMIPILNLLTPLFGIALMVHVHKKLNHQISYQP